MSGTFRRPQLRLPGAAVLILALCTLQPLCAAAASAPVPAPARPALDLGSLRGHVVVVDFWASWCVPCRDSFPWMHRMLDLYGGRGLQILTVDVDENRADGEHFLDSMGRTLPVSFDSEGVLAEQYKVLGMPTSIVFDRHGVERFRHIGFRSADRDEYEAQLRRLIDEP
jgi:thiol-disulfide isomerase/thioredoxin